MQLPSMWSAKQLNAIATQAKRQSQINDNIEKNRRLEEKLQTIPGLLETAANSGEFSCNVYYVGALTKRWFRNIPVQINFDWHLMQQLYTILKNSGYTVKIERRCSNFSKVLYNWILIVSWDSK